MAKGNMLQGMARGSVGDVTFTRLKGQQVSRVRNRQPSNPKTQKQMAQRSIFANAVRFFTRGNQNLFKFAFEDKKPNESDYNAFMRNNVMNSVYISKTAIGVTGYPAIGNWMMTNGSLPPIPMHDNIAAVEASGYAPTGYGCTSNHGSQIQFMCTNANITNSERGTVAGISKALIQNCYLSAGDIITFVQIYGDQIIATRNEDTDPWVLNGLVPDANPQASYFSIEPQWKIGQLRIDTSDTRTIEQALGPGWNVTASTISGVQNSHEWFIRFDDSGDEETAAAAVGVCMIASRNTSAGLKLSKQFLCNNEATNLAIAEALTDNFKQLCVNDWQATQDAILQGSLVNEA